MLSNLSRLFGGGNEDFLRSKLDARGIRANTTVPVVAADLESQCSTGDLNTNNDSEGLGQGAWGRLAVAAVTAGPARWIGPESIPEEPRTRHPHQTISSMSPAPLHPPVPFHLTAPLRSTLYIVGDLDISTHNSFLTILMSTKHASTRNMFISGLEIYDAFSGLATWNPASWSSMTGNRVHITLPSDSGAVASRLLDGSDNICSHLTTPAGSYASSCARPEPPGPAPPPLVAQQSSQVIPFNEDLSSYCKLGSGPAENQTNRAQSQHSISSALLGVLGEPPSTGTRPHTYKPHSTQASPNLTQILLSECENIFPTTRVPPRSELAQKTPETSGQEPVAGLKHDSFPGGSGFAILSSTLDGRREHSLHAPPSYDESGLVRIDTIVSVGEMSSENMFKCLVERGCPDLTSDMNPDRYSKRMVAAGSVGDIYRGELRDGTAVAIKMWRIFEYPTKSIKRASREIYNWSKMDHENVQKLLGVVMLDGRIGMVSEWMANGDLQAYVRRNQTTNRYNLCIQVAKGVQYLHNSGIVHGDLKAVNILVSVKGVPRLTDFDHSILLDGTLMFSETTQTGGGTARWMAPELHVDEVPRRNKKTDIYALGMTFLEIITGTVPYPECRIETQVIRKVDRQTPPKQTEHFTQDERGRRMWDLLTKCWNHTPGTRPTADSVLESLILLSGEAAPHVMPTS